MGQSEQFFLNTRLQLSGTHTPTLQDAIQLAARWAKGELDHMESTGRFEGYLIGSEDVGHETLRDHFSVRTSKALLAPEGLESRARQRLDQTVADELAKVSLPMPLPGMPFHKYLYEAFLAQHLELSEIAYKRHYGDYSVVFELPHEAPLSIDKAKAEGPSETLSVIFEHWARNLVTWVMGSATWRRLNRPGFSRHLASLLGLPPATTTLRTPPSYGTDFLPVKGRLSHENTHHLSQPDQLS